jgi:tetratricopeptide (TPR) repeat protein
MHNRLNIALPLLILVSTMVGCAKNDLAGLPMFQRIKESRKLYARAQEEIRNLKGDPIEEDLKRIEKAVQLITQAIEVIPNEPDYNFLYAYILFNQGRYHENQSVFWKSRANGFKLIKETGEWVKARPLPEKEDRDTWRKKAEQHRDVASEFFNRVLQRLGILDNLRPDNQLALHLRGRTYVAMLEMKKAREIFVRLSHDSRLTDAERNEMLHVVTLIDKDEAYKKELKNEGSSLGEPEILRDPDSGVPMPK